MKRRVTFRRVTSRWTVLCWAVAFGLAGLPGRGAAAEAVEPATLISDLSDHRIAVGAGFTGTDILVFGAIAPPAHGDADAGPARVVIVMRGKDRTEVVRRKERVAGIWVNRATMTFAGVPPIYLVAASGALNTVAPAPVLARHRIGLENLALPLARRAAAVNDDAEATADPDTVRAFRAALIRQRIQAGLFQESGDVVTVIGGALFRGSLRLPATVPLGRYVVDVYLLRGGAVVARNTLPLHVDRAGLELRLSKWSRKSPLLYGLVAVLVALGAGWFGTILLRER